MSNAYLLADLLLRMSGSLDSGPKLDPFVELDGSVAVFVYCVEELLRVELGEVGFPR